MCTICLASGTGTEAPITLRWRLCQPSGIVFPMTRGEEDAVRGGGEKVHLQSKVFSCHPVYRMLWIGKCVNVSWSLKPFQVMSSVVAFSIHLPLVYDVSGAASDRNCVVLSDIHIDIMDYIQPAACTDAEFRQMWAEFEWENKVS